MSEPLSPTPLVWTEPEPDLGAVEAGYGPWKKVRLMRGLDVLGDVQWLYTDGPFYPHHRGYRFGPFESLEGAKRRVEAEEAKLGEPNGTA